VQRLHQRPGVLFPVDDELTYRFGMKDRSNGIAPLLAAGRRRYPEQRKYSVSRAIARRDVPLAVEDDGRIRLLLPEDELERAPHMVHLGRGELAFAVDGGVAGSH